MTEEEKKEIEQIQIFIEAGKEYFKAYGECFITEGELKLVETALNVIQTQQAELEKKDKMIDLIADKLVEAHEWFYSEFDNYTKEDFKQYFEKQVEKEKANGNV